jgi:hypothetical protein
MFEDENLSPQRAVECLPFNPLAYMPTGHNKRYNLPSLADTDPGSGAFLAPGSGMGKKIQIRVRDPG